MRRTRGSGKKSQNATESNKVPSKTACTLLDSAVSAGKTSVTLTFGSGTPYDVDLKKMFQINPVTKYKRKIRCQIVKPESLSDADNSDAHNERPVQVKEEDEEPEEKPAAKRRRGKSRSQTKTEEIPKEEIKNEESVKIVVMKGKAPVDNECKAKLGKAHVHCEGKDVYDVMLNQTNLQFNNNKYYLIQLLEDDSSKVYSVWMRWGRDSLTRPRMSGNTGRILRKWLENMIWCLWTTAQMRRRRIGQQWILAPKQRTSKLDVKIQSLLELICDLKAMEECVLEMKFDIRKAPLGKLTSEQIRAGYTALKRIELCLQKKGSNRELVEACNQFYTRIPHDFGLKTPPVIRTEEELKEKIALLEALSDIQIAVKMVQSSKDSHEHPLDRQYHSLQCKLEPLDSSSHEYKFGKGIYFADMSSKSANYCFASQQNHVGLLLLCEVALGECNELVDADYEANNLPPGKHSTKGLGQTGPDPQNSVNLDGVTVPMGPAKKTGVGNSTGYSLLYNEYIVYNPAQTRMRYLLRIQFNYSSLW
ncbi:Poly [ADP-ribose] polymerase 2 [Channa argus]|uniref:Poly [ADP-ribose] polymerase n=1 Tax=Channa argus TaxID=215402 RepID=A0A6G1Q927_CHAAH|nr:Poly [ADP-ribose] polymerase 2 [Channa argus]